MKRMSKDVIIAIVLLFISGVVLWETKDLNKMSADFPKTIGYILLLLSIYYLIVSLMKPNFEKVFASINKTRIAFMCLGMVIYAFFIWLIGFLLASLLFMSFFVWYLQGPQDNQKRRVLLAGISSLIVISGFYSLFKYVFAVPLPVGLIFGG